MRRRRMTRLPRVTMRRRRSGPRRATSVEPTSSGGTRQSNATRLDWSANAPRSRPRARCSSDRAAPLRAHVEETRRSCSSHPSPRPLRCSGAGSSSRRDGRELTGRAPRQAPAPPRRLAPLERSVERPEGRDGYTAERRRGNRSRRRPASPITETTVCDRCGQPIVGKASRRCRWRTRNRSPAGSSR
jgi:hypothetical protein